MGFFKSFIRFLSFRTLKAISLLIFLTLPFYSNMSAANQIADRFGEGAVDVIKQEGNKVIAQGWAGPAKPSEQIASISVWLSGQKVYDSQFERYERPDVQKVTNRSDWLRSGWRLNFSLPEEMKTGDYTVEIVAKIDTGKEISLSANSNSKILKIDGSFNEKKKQIRTIKIIIATTLIILILMFFYAESFVRIIKEKIDLQISEAIFFSTGLIASFILFLAIGITGSSFSIGLSQAPFVKGDGINVSGLDQGIRSDEWLVLTPLAVAQFNHVPPNPVVNTNHGEDGQNMLIVGMTGVPVAHISEISKPATWGYFLFDLKRALSWNWLFPIFGCLLALWAVICIILPNNWKASFLLSLLFSSAPYVVAWSNWPAYAVFFPSLIFICLNSILRTEKTLTKLCLGVLAGITFAGFVFVLYPPWQVSLAYIFIALTVGVALRDKLLHRFNAATAISLIIATLIAGSILLSWWTDAKTAIEAMENTVYPGQRTTVVGGTMSLPMLLRGFTNVITLYELQSPYSNKSEIASFNYLLLPLALLFLLKARQKSLTAVEISLAVAILFIIVFMFVGIPTSIAKFSLWGRVPANRADLALGLATLLLSGLLMQAKIKTAGNQNLTKIVAVIVTLTWAIISYKAIGGLDDTIIRDLNINIMIALFITIMTLGYFLSTSNFKGFVYLSLAVSTATTLTFNPINIAPNDIKTTTSLITSKQSRVLVLDNMTPAMYLVASGTPVANGIFYYPQQSIWHRLDPNGSNSDTYNRYQHLIYSVDNTAPTLSYRLESPRPDVVKIYINAATFDFNLSGADLVTAPVANRFELEKNPKLRFINDSDGWTWFRISKQ
ncbi:hypothetical protein E4T63_19660 [Pseudomonas fluorescens]|uniref:Uncharacterized protein n=1 Tax=Pseudomonas fluorescens TaxID=294 RepID=A0AAP8Z3V8_PSEFL|nr:hypothetical protein [Pseudomonas fluorescens]QBX42677.1 hypothetical protein E4T63_19660 [Pseudomonas fluorescens]